jgi:N-acetyl-beta-hexosaminidase
MRWSVGAALTMVAGLSTVAAGQSVTYFDHVNALPLRSAEPAILDAAEGRNLAPAFVTTVADAYAFEPVPSELTAEEAAHVIGAKAELWTEWIFDGRELERGGFPRLAPFAEGVWTPVAGRDYADFAGRLATHLERLTARDVCYFGSPVAGCP